MKSHATIYGRLLVFALVFFTSCSKNAGNPSAQSPASDSITGLLTNGSWTISSLIQKKEDNTAAFSGYVFRFVSNGKLVATKNGADIQGSWSYSPAVTYYGSSSKDAITVNMGTDNPFRRLTKTWNLVSITSTAIKLDNPEILEDEHLQFQK